MVKSKRQANRLEKALPLFGFSFVEIAVAFVRMIILTHILGPYEFGFAVAISAAYATFEQITDLAIFRFVSSSPSSVFKDALAGAHALTILRGFLLALGILIISAPLACTLATCKDWASFAWMAPVVVIKSFEHLEIKVRERDYRFWPQLLASVASHGIGITVMAIVARETGSHFAFIAYLFAQAIIYVIASHLLAQNGYRFSFRSAYFKKALEFGFPLMINGIGLALIAQGDRLMVGALLGLTTLGLYAVLILAGTVPISGLFRILGPLQFAGLHNATAGTARYDARLKLFCRAMPMVAACYAIGVISFLQPLVPLVFGARYTISDAVSILIALIAFLRIVRIEPHTTLLLQTQNTAKLAAASLSLGLGLLLATALVLIYPSIESALIGSALGECIGLIVMIVMTRKLLKAAMIDYLVSLLFAFAVALIAYLALKSMDGEHALLIRTIIMACSLIFMLMCGSVFLRGPLRTGYGVRA